MKALRFFSGIGALIWFIFLLIAQIGFDKCPSLLDIMTFGALVGLYVWSDHKIHIKNQES